MSSDRSPARRFRDLRVWQKAHEFVLAVYPHSDSSPEGEKFGRVRQLRLAAVSIPANIAEGFGKRGAAEKARFLNSGRFPRSVPVLFDSVSRLGLRPERVADERPRRNQ
jgi:hypothetical protein